MSLARRRDDVVNSYSDYGVANALGFISYLIAGLVAWIYVRHNIAGQAAG